MNQKYIVGCISFIIAYNTLLHTQKPRLTVIVVVDQCAHHHLKKVAPFLQHGLHDLSTHAIVYESAHMPHGLPATGPGHAALSTGAFAKDHGIINNQWCKPDGTKIKCDSDTNTAHAVIAPQGVYPKNKSPYHLMMGGLSDTFVAASTPSCAHYAFSIGAKSRSTICTAAKLGKAIWFDMQSGRFTSSKYYFQELPDWVRDYNSKSALQTMTSYTWQSKYPVIKDAYNFYTHNDYRFSSPRNTLLNKNIHVDPAHKKKFYQLLEMTPWMTEQIFALATRCIESHLTADTNSTMLLWICISGLDKIGHNFGPQSTEAFDFVYHLDDQLGAFMTHTARLVDTAKTMWILTADHGIAPIPEISRARGIQSAQRIDSRPLIATINNYIAKKYGITDLCVYIDTPNLYLNMSQLGKENLYKRRAIVRDITTHLKRQPYIKNAWTYQELEYHPCCCINQFEGMLKRQLFPNRSGAIIVQTYPNIILGPYTYGDSHETPYEYNTHIPLMLYNPPFLENKRLYERVYALQLAPTLAHLLEIPLPDAAMMNVLPGIFKP